MLVEQMCFSYVLLLCYFVLSSICVLVYSKSNYSEMVSNIQCMFFSLCTYLKADDTYIQLKKDLEYLDLKVRFETSLLHFLLFFFFFQASCLFCIIFVPANFK